MATTTTAMDANFEALVKERIDLGDASWVLDWINENFTPEDVFDRDTLDKWASDNDWTR